MQTEIVVIFVYNTSNDCMQKDVGGAKAQCPIFGVLYHAQSDEVGAKSDRGCVGLPRIVYLSVYSQQLQKPGINPPGR